MVPDSVIACRPLDVGASSISFARLAPPIVRVRLPTVITGSWSWDRCRSNSRIVEVPTIKFLFASKPTGALDIVTGPSPRVIACRLMEMTFDGSTCPAVLIADGFA